MKEEALLRIESLSINLFSAGQPSEMLREVTLLLHAGRPLCLVGETGCGKTLIAQAVLRLLPPELKPRGRILYRGRDLLKLPADEHRHLWGKNLFLFPQEPLLALNPTLRALSHVAEVFSWVRAKNGSAPRRARQIMEKTGLPPRHVASLYPCQLSGGMRQRLVAAVALSEPAEVIVADEPTKGLDSARRDQVVDLLAGLAREGKTLFAITHDLRLVRRLGGSLAVMYGGRIMEQGDVVQVLQRPRHPYTRALLASMPEAGLQPIAARLHDRPLTGGCVFAPRCGEALARCFDLEPPIRGNAHGCRCHRC